MKRWKEANKQDLCFSYLCLGAGPKRYASLSLFPSLPRPQPALPLSPCFQPALAQAQAATPHVRLPPQVVKEHAGFPGANAVVM